MIENNLSTDQQGIPYENGETENPVANRDTSSLNLYQLEKDREIEKAKFADDHIIEKFPVAHESYEESISDENDIEKLQAKHNLRQASEA